ncbi:hypothetical protein INR49_001130, partial [Caranx melampygus]
RERGDSPFFSPHSGRWEPGGVSRGCSGGGIPLVVESELIQQMQAGATNRMRRRREREECVRDEGRERQQRRGLIALHHGLG